MTPQTKLTPMTPLQQAQQFIEVFEPVVARGIEHYPFKPSVKGDILLHDITQGMDDVYWLESINSVNGLEGIIGLGGQRKLAKWDESYIYYIPTLDQLMDYVLAFNESQNECYIEHFISAGQVGIFFNDKYLCTKCNGMDIEVESDAMWCKNEECGGSTQSCIDVMTSDIESLSYVYDYGKSIDTTLKIALAQTIAECENIKHGGGV